MAAKTQARRTKWFKELCEKGCQLCGRKIPSLQHNGLEWSHIISKKGDGGNDQQFNCLALCPTCARAFDTVIKPAIYHAFKKLSVTNIPESWKAGENRINSEDGDVD